MANTMSPTRWEILDQIVLLHLSGARTDGAFFVVEVETPPGGGLPNLHSHSFVEFWITLEGNLTYFIDQEDGRDIEETSGGPGTTAFAPGGRPHTFRNFTDRPARCLIVSGPAEPMETWAREAAAAQTGKISMAEMSAKLAAMATEFGLVVYDVIPEPSAADDELVTERS